MATSVVFSASLARDTAYSAASTSCSGSMKWEAKKICSVRMTSRWHVKPSCHVRSMGCKRAREDKHMVRGEGGGGGFGP